MRICGFYDLIVLKSTLKIGQRIFLVKGKSKCFTMKCRLFNAFINKKSIVCKLTIINQIINRAEWDLDHYSLESCLSDRCDDLFKSLFLCKSSFDKTLSLSF